MFDALSDRFEGIFKRLRGKGRISEADIDEVAREIRTALLEADVNVAVVRTFIERVKADALGAELTKSLSPAQAVVKIVHDELVRTLGGTTGKLEMSSKPPTVVMLAGLQGSGKTTAAAKLALHLKSQGRNPLLVGADLQRPAAVDQLRVLGKRIDVPVWSEPTDPVAVARTSLDEAARLGRDIVIVDTAGRLQIDEALMDELRHVRDAIQPHDTLLVVDAMTGQEAVNVAVAFNEAVGLDGVVLTKIDGDARGGAALSVKEVVGRPILFAGTGEKVDDFEPFHPDRMASRILGMGDVLTLIEKAERSFDEEQAQKAAEIVESGRLTLEDFLEQMQQVKKMGPLSNLMGMLPGMPKELKGVEIEDSEIARVEAIIRSMTPQERRNSKIIDGSRRSRIAKGAGTTTAQVNQLLNQFKQVQRMMEGPLAGMRNAATRTKGKGKKGRGRAQSRGVGGAGGIPGLPNIPGVTDLGGGPGGGYPDLTGR